jgi:hypothetical protein
MRKTKRVEVDFGGPGYRDAGKTFLLTEMAASDAEAWAIEALTLIASTGVNLPDGVISYGWAGMALVGLDGLMKVDFVKARPLLERMMACVQIVPDPKNPKSLPHAVTDYDVEEVQTRLWLRDKVFELHSGFCVADALREFMRSAAKVTNSQSPTPTSPSPSGSA